MKMLRGVKLADLGHILALLGLTLAGSKRHEGTRSHAASWYVKIQLSG